MKRTLVTASAWALEALLLGVMLGNGLQSPDTVAGQLTTQAVSAMLAVGAYLLAFTARCTLMLESTPLQWRKWKKVPLREVEGWDKSLIAALVPATIIFAGVNTYAAWALLERKLDSASGVGAALIFLSFAVFAQTVLGSSPVRKAGTALEARTLWGRAKNVHCSKLGGESGWPLTWLRKQDLDEETLAGLSGKELMYEGTLGELANAVKELA